MRKIFIETMKEIMKEDPLTYLLIADVGGEIFKEIKLDIIQQNANVKLIGYWDYPSAGPTHYTKNPKEICNLLGINYFEPGNATETKDKIKKIHQVNEPAFFYLT